MTLCHILETLSKITYFWLMRGPSPALLVCVVGMCFNLVMHNLPLFLSYQIKTWK